MSSETDASRPPPPPPGQRVISTHDANGAAVFSTVIPETLAPVEMPFAVLAPTYTTAGTPASLVSDADITAHKESLNSGLRITVPNGGLSSAVISLAPNAVSPCHRTVSLDLGVVISGTVELWLDGGEVRTLKAGDCVVQRAAMHQWRNVTGKEVDGGWARMFFVAQQVEAVEVGGEKLGEKWDGQVKGMEGKL